MLSQAFCYYLQFVFRLILTKEHIKWADILVPVGGDGTFLMTAGRASVCNPKFAKTPVVGFNSDPLRYCKTCLDAIQNTINRLILLDLKED